MCIKFSVQSVPCNNNSYHLLNTYLYRAVGFTCINHNNSHLPSSHQCTRCCSKHFPSHNSFIPCPVEVDTLIIPILQLNMLRPKDTQLVIEPASELKQSGTRACALSLYAPLLSQYYVISLILRTKLWGIMIRIGLMRKLRLREDKYPVEKLRHEPRSL